jgi:hypothetical protein
MPSKNRLFLFLKPLHRPALGVIFFLYSMTILIAGLWPLNFNPANKVEWIQNGNGIRFYGQGIAFCADPLVTQDIASKYASFTIELLLRPDKEFSNYVPSILTLLGNNLSDQFIVGQWKSELIIRVPVIKSERHKRYHEIAVGDALLKRTTHLITVTSEKDTTHVYVDGKRDKLFPHYSLIRDNRGLSGRMVLGNSPDGTAPWSGSFLGLAIYDNALNAQEALEHGRAWLQGGTLLLSMEKKPIALYLFDEHGGEQIQDHTGTRNHLLMPVTFRPLRRIILGMPMRDQWFSRSNLNDITVNIIGFVPFGFFLSAWLLQAKGFSAPRVYWIALFIGFCVSLAIELTQIYLPSRDSSLLDLIDNTLGTAIGVFVFKYAGPALQKKAR